MLDKACLRAIDDSVFGCIEAEICITVDVCDVADPTLRHMLKWQAAKLLASLSVLRGPFNYLP